ncbi:hypothetical protein UMM65_14715 [Aureibaculum sp. 2210JD6-5]|uniref:hypothetical protein n=1 Tax=Aureibaculum sp. 2210JD6-5 TaxID=3103957 RepID=UPI002AAF0692|nr:hypothetical protein [Aureibaculum sp. 2210JD6-5]MDY7396501.1 hypothetical protein [Aureibaculum sp. 2210JD6-5]
MRKYCLLLAFAIIFTACNKGNESTEQENLVGKWKLVEILEHNGVVNKIECFNGVVLHFKVDGTFDVEHFESDEANNCISMGIIDEGSWKNLGNNVYNIDGDKIIPKFEQNKLIMLSANGDETTSNGVFERQ